MIAADVLRRRVLMGLLAAAIVLSGGLPPASAEMTGMAWLANQPDVRSAILGKAVVAHVEDASAMIWNPAGLAGLRGGEGLLAHSESFADIRREFAALGRNYGPISVGGHFEGVWTENLDAYDVNGEYEGTFGYYGLAAGMAAGMPLGDRLRVGAGIKYIREAIDIYAADGWAVDLGAQWQTPHRPLRAGVAVLNLGPEPKFVEETFPIPAMVQAGVSYTVPLARFSSALLLSADVREARDRDTSFHAGMEYRHLGLLSLGVGYRSALHSQDLSLGVGVERDRFRFQLAFLPEADRLLGESLRLGLGVKIW